MHYRVEPGLYALGAPDTQSPVVASANYRLSFNRLRSSLEGRNVWILVLDTKGINVWCAAGKKTFSTKELVRQISQTKLASIVTNRTIVVPQLGAPGVAGHEVKQQTGFSVKFGPVRAVDLPAYLDAGSIATPAMRLVQFGLADRLALVPMEVVPCAREIVLFLGAVGILAGLNLHGILFAQAWHVVLPLVAAAITALICGSVVPPILLPWIPGRALAFKGVASGLVGLALLLTANVFEPDQRLLAMFCWIAVPAYSSYRAYSFTGSTTFTNPSGVKAELRVAWPLYVASTVIGGALLAGALLHNWGIV
jgi:hypothetical protein